MINMRVGQVIQTKIESLIFAVAITIASLVIAGSKANAARRSPKGAIMKLLNKFAARAALATSVMAAATLVSFAASASTVSYSDNGAYQQSIGDNLGTLFDQLTLGAVVGGTTNGGTTLLNPVTFNVGVNSCCIYDKTGTISESLTVGGITQTINLPYNIHIDYADTITFIGGETITVPGWQFVVNPLTLGPNGVGSFPYFLTATVTQLTGFSALDATTPLPAALPLFATGLGALGLLGWRKKRKAAAFAAA
jgi:hypothetical protein